MRNYRFCMHKYYEISDHELGKIAVTYSKKTRRILFRGENGGITAVVPHNFTGSIEYLHSLIDHNRKALKRLHTKACTRHYESRLYDGKLIEIVEGTILLKADNNMGRGRIRMHKENICIAFFFHPDDLPSDSFRQGFARYIMRTLITHYGRHLLQMVESYANRTGAKLKGVRIGRGQRVLGHCSRSGIITISVFVLLLPQHLRDYIIYHELAHLTHFDHSTAFHTLCNKYCQGNENTWSKELRKFTFPISL